MLGLGLMSAWVDRPPRGCGFVTCQVTDAAAAPTSQHSSLPAPALEGVSTHSPLLPPTWAVTSSSLLEGLGDRRVWGAGFAMWSGTGWYMDTLLSSAWEENSWILSVMFP